MMDNSYNPEDISPVRNSATPSGEGEAYLASQPHVPETTPPPVKTEPQRRLLPGVQLSGARYTIERLVAAGGMGAIYRSIDTRFHRPCAVKEMLDDFHNEEDHIQAVEWFAREATLLLDLNHPCIPRVRDFFVENDRHYLVMDFIEGRTLSDVLEKDGHVLGLHGARGISEARARSWTQQLCSVLGYLHRQSPPVIFRDLKPSNVMVTDRDEIKLIDFGIARTFQSQQQATIIMTVGYAPPEQLYGMPEPRSDLYALGATIYRMLTHHDAANNKPDLFSFPLLRTLRPDISPPFEEIVMKALTPTLQRRWAHASDMERALMNLPPISVTAPPPVSDLAPTILAGGHSPSSNSQTPSQNAQPGPSSDSMQKRGTGPARSQILATSEHITAGRIDAAYVSVQQAYALEPNNALVHKHFGQIFAHRQPPQPDLALRAYNHSIQLNQDDAETHKLVGDVYLFLQQQPRQAIPPYIQALRLNLKDVEAHQRLGQCYEKTNQFELAFREYGEAVQLAPKIPVLHNLLGQAALRLNRLPLAEQAFIQVLIINPADHPTRFLLSQVYEQQNKVEDAFRECNYIVGPLGASNPAVRQMHQRLRARLGR